MRGFLKGAKRLNKQANKMGRVFSRFGDASLNIHAGVRHVFSGMMHAWDLFWDLLDILLTALYVLMGLLLYATVIGAIVDVNADFSYWRYYAPHYIDKGYPTTLAKVLVIFNYLTIVGGAWDQLLCHGDRLSWAFDFERSQAFKMPKVLFDSETKPSNAPKILLEQKRPLTLQCDHFQDQIEQDNCSASECAIIDSQSSEDRALQCH